jgi:type I restriction enzyme, R subunit
MMREFDIENLCIERLQAQGYTYHHGAEIAQDGSNPQRESYSDVLLQDKLRKAVNRINPDLPEAAREEALKAVQRLHSPELITNNEQFHRMLTNGINVSYQKNGQQRGDLVWLIDFDNPGINEFNVVNQFTVIENGINKRPDVVLFINGLPLVVMELKNPADEKATIKSAYQQLGTYMAQIPGLFTYNAFSIISDGIQAKAGSISADLTRFMAWKTADGKTLASSHKAQAETLIKGMLNKETMLDLIRHFIVFESSKQEDPETGLTSVRVIKKLAAYHQYYAVNRAVESVKRATGKNKKPEVTTTGSRHTDVAAQSPEAYAVPGVKQQSPGDRKGGVVWHTQGSGKSLSMVFFAGKIILALDNPTLLVITDRNDLDNQLFDTFAASKQLLRQEPVQAESRADLKQKLKVGSGGVVFTTIQKFHPQEGNVYEQLSGRENIVVIADEAHRTQYGFKAKTVDDKAENGDVLGKKIVYGFAKYMRDALPNATYLGFTGTPVEKTDHNTPAVFGHYIDVYDIAQAVEDGATVKIFYESRLAKVNLSEEGKQLVDELDEKLQQDDLSETQKAKAKWTRLEALIGSKQRLKNLAEDMVKHFEERTSVLKGKGMVVAMSRRIAAELYDEIIKLRPDWHSGELKEGKIKVVMTGASSDGPEISKHHSTKEERQVLANRMKDPEDELQMVIVRDMWLTGFDAPSLHTMYIDKPMRGHNLMQAIARVNRVYKDKPGGLIVDYLGIASDLKKALSFYSDAGGKGDPTIIQEKAVQLMLEKLEVVSDMLHGFAYETYFEADTSGKLSIILAAQEFILGEVENGKKRFTDEVTALSKAFAIAVPHEQAMDIKDEVSFFQAVKSGLVKLSGGENGLSDEEMETTIRQVIDKALVSDQVIDVFDAAGIKKPDISILSEEFLLEIKNMEHKNVAMEVLKKILRDEINARSKTNHVKSKSLKEMLDASIKKYQNKILTAAEVIDELIKLSREIVKSDKEAAGMGLSDFEYAFYTAVADNKSAREVMQKDMLRELAVVLTDRVRENAAIDWTIKESVRAKLKVIIKRTLRQYGYPPDMQKLATETVLKQAEKIASELVG